VAAASKTTVSPGVVTAQDPLMADGVDPAMSRQASFPKCWAASRWRRIGIHGAPVGHLAEEH